MIVLGTAVSGWIGWLLAGKTILPVRRLAQAVDELPPRPQATNLASLVGEDELGRLATAIDAYQRRLLDTDAAERAFFADASHELRTPIAVVQGVAEVLLDDSDAPPPLRRRLARLERGMNELTDLINVLLGLARRSAYVAAATDAQSLLQESVAAVLSPLEASSLRVEIEAAGTLQLPYAESVLALRGILRRLLPPAAGGVLSLQARPGRIELVYDAAAPAAASLSRTGTSSDQNLGLTLIGRFAAHLGWQIEEAPASPTQRRIVIVLPAAESI